MSHFEHDYNDERQRSGARADRRRTRRGLTLTELLVVVSIVVLLAAVLLPMIQPIMRGRKVREASRQVNVMLAAAQARAVESGKPAGIWLERFAHEPGQPVAGWYTAFKIFEAEQPEPYTGDVFDARVIVRPNPTVPGLYGAFFQDPGPDPDPSPLGDPNRIYQPSPHCCGSVYPMLQANDPLIEPGDTIRFEGLDRDFVIHAIDNQKISFFAPYINPPMGNPSNAADDIPDPMVTKLIRFLPSPTPPMLVSYQPGLRFEVRRRPIKTAKAPLELPRNSGIDLSVSGYDRPLESPFLSSNVIPASYKSVIPVPGPVGFPTRFREVSPEYDIVIMFSPDGGVDRVHYIAHQEPDDPPIFSLDDVVEKPYFWERPQGPIRLMVARDDEIARDVNGNINVASTTDYLQNVQSPLGEATLHSTDNLWITINGTRISNAPNANAFASEQGQPLIALPITSDARGILNGTLNDNYLKNAQRFARSSRSMGGR